RCGPGRRRTGPTPYRADRSERRVLAHGCPGPQPGDTAGPQPSDTAAVVTAVPVPAGRGPDEAALDVVLQLEGPTGLDQVVPGALRAQVLDARHAAVLPGHDVVELAGGRGGGASGGHAGAVTQSDEVGDGRRRPVATSTDIQ